MFSQDTLTEAAIITPEQLEQYRNSSRKPVHLDVTLYCHGYVLTRAQAKNLGPDGMFIDAGHTPTSRHAYLEVEFVLKDHRGTKLYRLPVYPSKVTAEGTDLRFVDTYVSAFRYITDGEGEGLSA